MMIYKKTPLFDEHIFCGGKIVEFAGYGLPISYTSIIEEHDIVRKEVGVFDVSHMGEFSISGPGALEFLQKMTTNDLSTLNPGQAQYSILCNEKGGIIDDLIIYKKQNEYLMVVNASNSSKNFKWLNKHANKDVLIKDISEFVGLLAIQGPKSRNFLDKISDIEINRIAFYNFKNGSINGIDVMISRTGYTGELGYEIYVHSDSLIDLWCILIKEGKKFGLRPVGLGCRDTLRMEMRYPLYGVDINENTNPIEAGLQWAVKFNKENFIGRNKLLKIQKNPTKRLVCIEMNERAIPRYGNSILFEDLIIGKVTSGTMSPSLKKGICMGYVDSKISSKGNLVSINIRGKNKKGVIVKSPFHKRGSLLD